MPELNIIGAKEENRYFPYQAAFRVTRKSFWQAGQDSFTNPPAQNPDLFQALTNVEPVLQGNLQRRRGYTLFSNTSPVASFREGYAFRSETFNLRRLIWTSSSTVVALDEAGMVISSPLFTPSLTANTVRMVLSRSYGYFADGVRADYLKWDGTANTNNLTNWGIDVQNTPAAIFGPKAPTAAVDGGGGLTVWSNPTNIEVQDGVYTTNTLNDSQSNTLKTTGYGFAVTPASATITGITVDLKGFTTDTTLELVFARLLINGVATGNLKALSNLPASNGFITFGGSTDAWGLSLIGSDVNNVNFGVQLFVSDSLVGNVTFSLDYVQITINVSGSSILLGAPAGTGITLLSGRIYTVAFQNSSTGTVSDITPFSSSTGPLTNQGQPLSGLPVSSDSQVDTKLLLATADGGDTTTLYLVTQLPNATTTYTDVMPDTQLLTQPIFQQTNQDGTLHGVVNNKIPPLFNFPTKHKGRIYGSIQSTLYFSKNLDDVTTSTGTITSKWEEAFPATYAMDASELAETITALLSDGETLWIATDHNIRRLIGDSPSNFQKPEIEFNEAGVINMEVWKVVFAEGQPVGTMWLTPDNRAMWSDFNSYQDVGSPIQDVLNTINTAVAQNVAHACFVSRGPAEYYMLYIPTGISTVADTVCVYNLRAKKWVIWKPTDTVTASLFNLNATGVPQWLFATQLGPLYQWDNSVRVDRNGNTPVQYAVPVKTSWLDFGDEGLTKAFNKILVTTQDTNLTVGVQGAIRDSDLDSGGQVVIPATTLTPEIFGDLFVPMVAQPGLYKWYQVTFTSPASSIVDVLDAFDFEIAPSMRM